MKNRNIKLFTAPKIQIGMRLFMAAFALLTFNWTLLAIAALTPIFGTYSVNLGIAEGELDEVKKLINGLADKTKETVKTEVSAALVGLITEKELTEKFEALGLKDDAITKLHTAMKEQGTALEKLLMGGKAGKDKSVFDQLEEHKDALKAIAKGTRKESISITAKTLVERDAVSNNTMAYRVPGLGELPVLETVFSRLMRNVNISADNGVIRYLDQQAITRNAANVAEAAQKPESAITWVERTIPVEKIADSIPVSKEALADLGFVRGELDRLLNINLALKLDQQLYNGTGLTPEIKGLLASAPAFVGTPYDDSVDQANLYDLIATLRVDIMNNRQSKYSADIVTMNPVDIRKMKLAKASDGHYIMPPFVAQNGQVVDGVRIVESSQVVPNSLLIGDFRYATLYNIEGITMDIGVINDQFIKNTVTMLAEMRCAQLVRIVDETAFRKVANITTAIAALETP